MSCASALQNFAARDFTGWTGLPETCSLTEVTERFRLVNDGYGLALIGRFKRQFRMLVMEGYDHPVRVWSDESRVLMLDVEYPSLSPAVADLLNHLGEPEAKFDYHWRTMRIEKGEWVYADRGLTLFLSSDHSRTFQLAVFPRTTMQGYEENFQLDLGERRFPAR